MLKHLQTRQDWADKSFGAKGFTLIELLVVIVILGILAAVAIFAIGSIRDDANDAACETEAKTISTAAEAKFTADDTYVAPLDSLKDPIDATRWTYVGTTSGFTLTGVGKCAGITVP